MQVTLNFGDNPTKLSHTWNNKPHKRSTDVLGPSRRYTGVHECHNDAWDPSKVLDKGVAPCSPNIKLVVLSLNLWTERVVCGHHQQISQVLSCS